MIDWKREIAVNHLVKQKIAKVQTVHSWEHPFPEVAASEQAVGSIEAQLGFKLDKDHRDFLRHANGWKSFYQAVDMFGVADLVGGPRHQRAMELLDSLEELEPLCGFAREHLLPIAVSNDDIDVFVISKPSANPHGAVLWLAGGLIDRFPSFSEWFLAMIDYNRHIYQQITNSH